MKRAKGAGARALPEDHSAALELAVRQALMSRNSGCFFARALLAPEDGPVDFIEVTGDFTSVSGELDEAFDDAAAASKAVIALFPEIATMAGLVDLLCAVSAGERWTLREVAWKQSPLESHLLVGIEWRTKSKRLSSVMGLSPFRSTPIYRRVPCVGMVLWPGGERENEHWEKKSASRVSLVYTPTPFSKAVHDRHKEETHEMTKALRALPGSQAAQPNVAFVVPTTYREHLVGACKMAPLRK